MKPHAAEKRAFAVNCETAKSLERQTLLESLQRDIAMIEGRLSEKVRLDLPTHLKGEYPSHSYPRPREEGAQSVVPIVSAINPQANLDFEGEANKILPFTFGSHKLDQIFLDGSHQFCGLFEAFGKESREAGTLSGFAHGLLAAFLTRADGDILWVQDQGFTREAGVLYGPGLAQFGLNPARLLIVSVSRAQDALWVMEEGLATQGIIAVCGAFSAHLKADLTATRRLSLRAHRQKKPALLLRLGASCPPTAARARAHISPASSAVLGGYEQGVGRPVYRVCFDKLKGHPPTDFHLEWRHEDIRFTPAATHTRALASTPFNGSRSEAEMGAVLAFGSRAKTTGKFRYAS